MLVRLLVFTSLTCATLITLASGQSNRSLKTPHEIVTQDHAPSAKHFRELSVGSLIGKGIVSGTAYSYVSDDNVTLSLTIVRYHFDSRSAEEFAKVLKRATKTIEQGTLIRDGEKVPAGKRAVVMCRCTRSNSIKAVSIWTDGPAFYKIESASLERVLEFQKQVYGPQSTNSQ